MSIPFARTAPQGPAASVLDTVHGRTVPDPYRWLEDGESTATRRWLDARQREFTEAARTWPMRDRLAADITRLLDHDLWSPPLLRGGTAFATRRSPGDEHPRIVALEDALEGGGAHHGGTGGRGKGRHAKGGAAPRSERTVFDPVAADPSGRTTLDAWEPSPDGSLVAVQTSTGGTEHGELHILRTRDGSPVEPPITGVRYSHVAWLPPDLGGPAFFYARRDGADGRRGLWLHRVPVDGAAAAGAPDVLVRACTGPRTVPGVRVLGGRLLLATESHGTGHRNDVWIADLHASPPDAPAWVPVQEGLEAETTADLGPDGVLYLRTTLDAPRRRICAADPAAPAPGNWREVVPEDPDAPLDGFTAAGTPDRPELLVARTRLGVSSLDAHDARDGRRLRAVDLPGEGMVTRLEQGPDGTAHFCYADVATPQGVLLLDPGAARPRPWPSAADGGRPPAPAARIRRRVLRCRSADGTRVPITLLSAPGSDPDEGGPLLLHAYGCFGRPRQFGFSATVLAWLRAGGRYAVAHVRGGGDGGRDWHRRGAGRAKPRAVEDLVAAADALVEGGHADRARLCLTGGSAGGMLVLAAAGLRPDLCAAVISSAPLTDMARFERMGLGRMWTREFGTAADPDDFAALLSYSPYHLALDGAGGRRPAVLLTGFHSDTRTGAAHPRKMCAALQGAGAPALLRYERDVGHGQRAVSRAVALAADAHAFAAERTGLRPRPGGR
ncbi:prolyl oligopeptidase family serine peptidase [Nocardiopsis sp. RSe5-2]|uniref:prolyl oligopeptidase n=1 Tax=Nocardiopsis endophytica TaxID=3018445 RepID=A0ABT4U5P8_9ACTN|nr:prolyl oligopeptidase family serine peptidase [Nocardiopsis endophytica]MDA2811804.1 prolyl oligopeptidase family serine peptidase [Nocardiopsis endophytica]